MPNFDESRQSLLHAGESAAKRTRTFFEGFLDWVLEDNVLEVALGLIIAAAFTQVVNSFVSDILLPPISLLPFLGRNLDEKFAVLRSGTNYTTYNTLQQARDDGAVVLAYGTFLENIIRLVGLGLSLYILGLIYGTVTKDNVIKHKIKCRYCRKRISTKAKRCVNCTSWQDGRED